LSSVLTTSTPVTRVRALVGWIAFLGAYLFLYAPLLTIGIFALNDSTVQALPWSGFTLRWFLGIPENGPLISSLTFGLTVSVLVVTISGVVGTFFAVVLNGRVRRTSNVLTAAVVIPAIVPGMVLGLSLAITFRYIGLSPGQWTIVLGQLTFTLPVVVLVVLTRLRRLDPSLVQASMDLGATRWRTFCHVVFPQIRSTVLAACLLTFTLSFDEVIVTFFLAGTQPTFPLYIWAQTRFGFTPEINAIVTIIGTFSVILIIIATYVIGRQVDPYATSGTRRRARSYARNLK
jgi:ABC-type spermidine/putrescine transport system permease subunit II